MRIAKFLFKKENMPLLLVIAVELFILFAFIVPFFIKGSIYTWDMAGHYFSAYYTKAYLLPELTLFGWNPYHFWGFPQNQFYPPLFTILTSSLGYVLPLNIAFKLIVAVSVLLTPVSLYYFLINHSISKKISAYITALLSMILIFSPSIIGGNLITTFLGGAVSNALALPLLFFYLTTLKKNKEGISVAYSAILLALLVLTHVFYGIAGIILSLGYLFSNFKKQLLFFFKHYVIAFFLTAFWSLPFIFKINYVSKYSISFTPDFFLLAVSFLLILLYYILNIKELKEIVIGYTILCSFLLFATLFDISNLFVFRFKLLIYLLDAILLFLIFSKLRFSKKRFYLVLFLITLLYPLTEYYGFVSVRPPEIPKLNYIPEADGRILVAYLPSFDPLAPHLIQNKLPIDHDLIMTRGLFVESSKNSKLIYELISVLYYCWEDNVSKRFGCEKRKNIEDKLSLLDINYVYARNFSYGLVRKNALSYSNYVRYDDYLNLYNVSDSMPVEILNYTPGVFPAQWDTGVLWWLVNTSTTRVFAKHVIPEIDTSGSGSVRDFSFSDDFQEIRFFVNSDKDKNILIKQSFFPNWKAYVSGVETHIYLVTPNFMLIQGRGNVLLRYEFLWIDKLGTLLSLFGVLMIIIYHTRKKHQQYSKKG